MRSIYTGIGSRDTPQQVLKDIAIISREMSNRNFVLRSGGAVGADVAFENAHNGEMQIFLPYNGFNGKRVDNKTYFLYTREAYKLASKFHPKWGKLSDSAKQFHARNVHQVLGLDLQSPTDFIVCWTSDGKASGGTGQALRIAKEYGIHVYNLYNGPFSFGTVDAL